MEQLGLAVVMGSVADPDPVGSGLFVSPCPDSLSTKDPMLLKFSRYEIA